MHELSKVITPTSIVVGDASYSTAWITTYIRANAKSRFLTPRGLAGLGWGLPMAIGAKLAAPQSTIFCIVGDGGFAHVWSELETAHRTDTSVIVTVLNNGVLACQKDAEDVRHGRHTEACYLSPVNHAEIARACGCHGYSVATADDYASALHQSIRSGLPSVIDVRVDPNAYPPLTAFDDKLEQVRAQGFTLPRRQSAR